MRALLVVYAVFLLASATRHASAQLTGSVGGGVAATRSSVGWNPGPLTVGTVRIDRPLASLQLDGSVSKVGHRTMRELGGHAMLATPVRFGARITLEGDLRSSDAPFGTGIHRGSAVVALDLQFARTGAWIGAHAVTPREYAHGGVVAGFWRQQGNAMFSIATRRQQLWIGGRAAAPIGPVTVIRVDTIRNDTMPGGFEYIQRQETRPGDSRSGRSRLHVLATEARLSWVLRDVLLEAVVGGQQRIDSTLTGRRWMHGQATIPVRSHVALIAGVGQRAIAEGGHRARYLILGVRLAPGGTRSSIQPVAIRPVASGIETERVAEGVRFRVRVPSARMVELAGDFNAWTPVRLRLTKSEMWETIIPLAAGSHRMSIRVDGGVWRAPPGTAEVDDDFDGSVGIVIVP
jgi:hypothetical protein